MGTLSFKTVSTILFSKSLDTFFPVRLDKVLITSRRVFSSFNFALFNLLANSIIVFLFIVGFIINFTLFVLYTLLIFKNSFVKKISNFCIKLLRKITNLWE